MAKRRLIKKINEVSEEDLAQTAILDEEEETKAAPSVSAASNAQLQQHEQEIRHLRELLEEYRLQEADFEQEKADNFRLSQQNKQLVYKIESTQEEMETLRDRNDELETFLNQKDAEIEELRNLNNEAAAVETPAEPNTDLVNQLEELQKENQEAQQQISNLEAELLVKNKEIETKIAAKEEEIKQLQSNQSDLSAQDDTKEKHEALETVKMELEELNRKLQSSEAEKDALSARMSDLQQQLNQLQSENQQLKNREVTLAAANGNVSGTEHLEELKKELQTVLFEKSELESNMGRIQALNDKYSIQKDVFESELATLRKDYKEKEAELEAVQAQVDTLSHGTSVGDGKSDQLVELLQAKQQINDLLLKNQSLQEEAFKSQQEIGEVMVSAKKEANRIISEAKVEAKHMINSAELEMLNIGNRAKNISNEVEESKNEIMSIYSELEERLNKLSRLDKTGN